MEQGYLIDTNTAIYYLDNKLPDNCNDLIDNINSQISVITRMELLGWTKITPLQLELLKQFIDSSTVFPLDEAVIIEAIEVRKKYHIKLPDAIIAATALVYDLTLITSNTKDFTAIDGLKIIDPHSL